VARGCTVVTDAPACGGEERRREGDGVRAVQGQDVALADPRLGERGGQPAVEHVQLAVREGGPVDAVDQRGGVAQFGGTAEDGVVDGLLDGRNICVLAAEHGSSWRDCGLAQYDLGRPRVWWET